MSKNLRERFNSLSMKAVLARGRRGAGLRANSRIALSFSMPSLFREFGRVSAREDGGDLRDVGHKAGELAVSCVGARGVKLCDAGVRRADGGAVGLEGCPPPVQRGRVKPLGERGRVLAPQAGYRFACLGEVYAHTVPEPALPHLHTLDPVEGDAKGLYRHIEGEAVPAQRGAPGVAGAQEGQQQGGWTGALDLEGRRGGGGLS